ncbi:MAG: hypothetical protein AAF561_07340 [Planctomycetota bacterium]
MAAAVSIATPVLAGNIEFDQNVAPDVIFGSGNANGAFTTNRENNVELALRAKLRFNDSNDPENTFNSDGAGTYTFEAGTPPEGFGFALNSPTTPIWNFEWSINTDLDGSSGVDLNQLTYELRIDGDASSSTDFLTFDPINVPVSTHRFGDNSTGNGAGVNAGGSELAYGNLIADNNVAQNSWNYEFFNDAGTALENFNPNFVGTYTIQLEAFSGGNSLGFTSIDVSVVPEPVAAMGGLSLLSLLGLRRRLRAG